MSKAVNYAVRALRRATAGLRAVPGLLIIGAARSGTTSLWDWLSHHPQLAASYDKEVHYFDINPEEGESWYRAHFGLARRGIIHFEATPTYMLTKGAARQAHDVAPGAAIVALLREPADRIWSLYRLRASMGREDRPLEVVVRDELSAGVDALVRPVKGEAVPYITGGLYAEQLREWVDAYGRESLFLIDSHEMFTDGSLVVSRLEQFLGIDEIDLPVGVKNAVPSSAPDDEAMATLRDFYATPNRQLAETYDFHTDWT